MKTILIATDFSDTATNAAEYAADMAMAVDAGLLVVNVHQIPYSLGELPVASSTESEIIQQVENDMNALVAHLAKKTDHKLNIKSEIRAGEFLHELKHICQQVKPYTVIMGSQGRTGIERLLFGGHAITAMKNLTWPLVTVPQGSKFSAIKKIGFACDLEDVIETTPVDEIKRLVKDFNAELHILNTGKSDEYSPELVFEAGLMQELLAMIKPQFHFISSGNVDEGIIAFAENNLIDLLVVLPKRHSLLDMLVHKSHTRQLILHSHVPVMALHQVHEES